MLYRRLVFRGITSAFVIAVLVACGGGGGGSGASSSSGAGINSVGTISGFGSIYVNGVEFGTHGATYRVDEEDWFDESALAVGMKVRVNGTINDNGTTGTATRIF
jgi:hypothetical protein